MNDYAFLCPGLLFRKESGNSICPESQTERMQIFQESGSNGECRLKGKESAGILRSS